MASFGLFTLNPGGAMDLHALKRHPLSEIWGDMPEEEYRALSEDIGEHGIQTPITLQDGMVLDGWHRLKAAIEHGMFSVPTLELGEDEDPATFVIRANGLRRHLTKGQRVAIVLQARSHQWRSRGAVTLADRAIARTNKQLAEEAGASVGLVKATKKAFREGHGDDLVSGKETVRSIERKNGAPSQHPQTALEKCQARVAELKQRVRELEAQVGQGTDTGIG